MNPETDLSSHLEEQTASSKTSPSVDFITAISEFFETDPSDLLVELGYYKRDTEVSRVVD